MSFPDLGPMIDVVRMRKELWQDVLLDLLKLKDLDNDIRLGSLALIDELIDTIVESETT